MGVPLRSDAPTQTISSHLDLGTTSCCRAQCSSSRLEKVTRLEESCSTCTHWLTFSVCSLTGNNCSYSILSRASDNDGSLLQALQL